MSNQNISVTGELAPAYLKVTIDTDEDLTHLDKLPPDVQRAYFHEFVHYLQYNTSGYGLYYYWHVYDRLVQLLASLRGSASPIIIPLSNQVQQEKKELEEFFSKLRGGKTLKGVHPLALTYYELKAVEIGDDPVIKKHFPKLEVKDVLLDYRNKGTGQAYFRFGETAISECMARLIEFQHYGHDPNLGRFPYYVAEELVNFEYPHVASNPELLFALCDVSLMHPHPGWAFYQLLQQMKADNAAFTKGEEVIAYGLRIFANQNWRIPYLRLDALKGINNSIDALFHLPEYEHTSNWVKTVIKNGEDLRSGDNNFLIKLFRDKPFTGMMNTTWKLMGGPHCINKKLERKMKIPEELEQKDPNYVDKVFPQRLLMIWQMYEFLVNGRIDCGLYDICNNSKPPTVDGRCKSEPWKRVHEKYACPYAVAMHMWGLHPRIPPGI